MNQDLSPDGRRTISKDNSFRTVTSIVDLSSTARPRPKIDLEDAVCYQSGLIHRDYVRATANNPGRENYIPIDYFGSGSKVPEEAFFDAHGRLVTVSFSTLVAGDRWWMTRFDIPQVVTVPRGDLYWSPLENVDWSSRSVPVSQLRPVQRPIGYDSQLERYRSRPTSQLSNLTWSPNGEFVAGNVNGYQIGLWRSSDGSFVHPVGCNSAEYREIPHNFFWGQRELRWSPDGRHLACATRRRIYVWEVATSRLVCEFFNPAAEEIKDFPFSPSIAWSPDSTRLVAVSNTGDLEIYGL